MAHDPTPRPRRTRGSRRRLAAAACAVAFVSAMAVGCGGGDRSAGPDGPSTPAGERGWLDGEPEWSAGDDGGETAADAMPAAGATEDGRATDAVPGPSPAPDGLRAGHVDDGADYEGFLDYLARIADLGIVTRPFDATGRVPVTVTSPDGDPAAGVRVSVSSGGAEVGTVTTTADGTARVLPGLLGAGGGPLVLEAPGADPVTVEQGEEATLVVDEARPVPDEVPLDVLFLLDATGSMGDEIDRLTATIDTVAEQIEALPVAPDVRFGMTLYRDEGDTFVTSTYDFTRDVAAFGEALDSVVAEGGGDTPEALDEALVEALDRPAWRPAGEAVQLVLLVADAPPQVGREVPVDYVQSAVEAAGRGVKVLPVASSGTEDQAEAVFRQLAFTTGAPFVFLSGGPDGAATGESTDIDPTDYEELPLDALVVRLITDELAPLTPGEDTHPPNTHPSPPTTPTQ